jgi:hypothetical protein
LEEGQIIHAKKVRTTSGNANNGMVGVGYSRTSKEHSRSKKRSPDANYPTNHGANIGSASISPKGNGLFKASPVGHGQ